MTPTTRAWLEHLARVKNNSKAREILAYIERLEDDNKSKPRPAT